MIDFGSLTSAVVDAGYTGDIEVELFNEDIWATPHDEVVRRTAAAFGAAVSPHLQQALRSRAACEAGVGVADGRPRRSTAPAARPAGGAAQQLEVLGRRERALVVTEGGHDGARRAVLVRPQQRMRPALVLVHREHGDVGVDLEVGVPLVEEGEGARSASRSRAVIGCRATMRTVASEISGWNDRPSIHSPPIAARQSG